MKPLHAREFAHRLVVVTTDPRWTTDDAAATAPVRAGEDYRGYVRIADGSGFRYAFVGGRQHWIDGAAPVSGGLLFEVSPRLRIDPRAFPSDGARFREIGEVAVANDPALMEGLRAGYAR